MHICRQRITGFHLNIIITCLQCHFHEAGFYIISSVRQWRTDSALHYIHVNSALLEKHIFIICQRHGIL